MTRSVSVAAPDRCSRQSVEEQHPYYVTAGGQPWTEGNEVTALHTNTYTVSVRDENDVRRVVMAIVKQPENMS